MKKKEEILKIYLDDNVDYDDLIVILLAAGINFSQWFFIELPYNGRFIDFARQNPRSFT